MYYEIVRIQKLICEIRKDPTPLCGSGMLISVSGRIYAHAQLSPKRFDEKKEDRKNLSTANTFLTRFYCPVVLLCCKWWGGFEIVN